MNYRILCDIFRKNRDYTALLEILSKKITGKLKPYTVSGLTDGSQTVFLAALSEDLGNRTDPPVLMFADDKKASSFRDFLVSLGIRAAYFPAREYCFSNITSSHETEGERLCVLSSLCGIPAEENRPEVICTTAEAALQITVTPERLSSLCITISFDEPLDTDQLASALTTAGYARCELVESQGQFAIRGGIVDVYPPDSHLPLRIELFGDEVDRMGYFSPETQRFTDDAPEEVVLSPVRELLLPPETRAELIEVIKKHIRKIGRTE